MINDEYLKEKGLDENFFNYFLKSRKINSTIQKITFLDNYLNTICYNIELSSNEKVVLFIYKFRRGFDILKIVKELLGLKDEIILTIYIDEVIKIKRDLLISNILN